MTSITQGKAASHRVSTASSPSERTRLGEGNFLSPLGHRIEGHFISETEHGAGNVGRADSVSSSKSSKLGFRKRLSRFFKGDKAKDVVVNLTSTAALDDPAGSVEVAALNETIPVVVLEPSPPTQPAQEPTNIATVPSIQLQPTSTASSPLHLGIFPQNLAVPTLTTQLPMPCARIEQTTQLVYGCSVLVKAQPPLPAADTDDHQEVSLDETQRKWVQLIDSIEQSRLQGLLEQLVRVFAKDMLKVSTAVGEIVLLGPVLDRETYRSLLSCFISRFEQTELQDVVLLQGLVQLIECASSGYLVDDDLVRITTALSKELNTTQKGSIDHPLLLTWALSRVLDVMVTEEVKDLNRDRDHQPMLQLLDGLRGSDNPYLKYQVAYAYQALQYAPDDETPLQAMWRITQQVAAGASTMSSVFKMDVAGLLEGLASLQDIGADLLKAAKTGIETFQVLRDGVGMTARASEAKFDFMKKRSWYLALQGTAFFIRQGRLSDFNHVVWQASCRNDVNFQWGICRQLGEIAVDPLWTSGVRCQAVIFLGELYRSNTGWKAHTDVKRWILALLIQISEFNEKSSVKDHALALLSDLKTDGTTAFPGAFPLSCRLSLPGSFPLLARVEKITSVEGHINTLRMQRIGQYKQAVYIAPVAKASLQAPDGIVFSLMEKVDEFLAGDCQVMLVLGDSGAGKSTFSRLLEHKLLQDYQPEGRVPLFINLPALDRPDKELIEEQLKVHRFSDAQILELEQHRQFTLICDGYDESQLTSNLHTTNLFNQPGRWDVKLIVTCRTQYLGPDYRDRFAPKATGQYHRTANNLFQEAVIAPFSKEQIELYVEKFVPLIPRTWVKKDYMDRLAAIPNLMDLVRNPFLLTLALEALPSIVKGRNDLLRLRITRVELYDTFVDHWLGANKRRLQDQTLKDKRQAFEDLLAEGFVQSGIIFQKDLASAIFQEQDGRPIVEYSNKRDKSSWKARFFGSEPERSLLRDSSLLSRTGNQYRFVHHSILEYFLSRTVWDTATEEDEFAPHVYSEATGLSLPVADHPLSKRNLVPEPSIIQFLAERVQMQPIFKQYLLALIELSKSDPQASIAASNAITILVRAGAPFNGADLRGIRIPGADLTAGQFDSAQLQDSNLTGVNFTKAWIRQADFTRARMEETRFGELPSLREEKAVLSCAFSPDGKSFAAGLKNGNIRIYDTATWRKIRLLHGHEFDVRSIAYSVTSLQLISCCYYGTVRLWDSETGKTVHVLKGHSQEVRAVAFSPSGMQFASASADLSVRLWDTRSGTIAFVIKHFGNITGIGYSPDGNNIASCCMDGKVRVFDTQTGLLVLSSGTSDVGYYCLGYSPNGQSIVSGDATGRLQLWEATTMTPRIKWTGHSRAITSVAFSPNGQWIVSGSNDKMVKLWDGYTATLVSVFTGHSNGVTNIAFSPDGSLIASGSLDRTVRLWEVNSAGFGFDVDDAFDSKTSVAYSPDGQFLVSSSDAGAIQQHDAESGEIGLAIRHRGFRVNSVAYSLDGRQIAVGGSEDDITLWSAHTGALENTLRGHTRDVRVVAFSPCGQWIASSSNDQTVRLWDARSGASIQVISIQVIPGCYTNEVHLLSFSSSGAEIALGGAGTVQVWDVMTGKCKIEMGEDIGGCCFVRYLPMSLRAVSCHGRKGVRLWDEDGQHSRIILQDYRIVIDHFAFSSCGQWIASVQDDTIHLWRSPLEERPQSWTYELAVEGCVGVIGEIVWRPNKLEFATADEGGSIRVWRVIEESERVRVQMLWGSGGGALAASGSLLYNAIGLNTTNRNLLEQPAVYEEEFSPLVEGDFFPCDEGYRHETRTCSCNFALLTFLKVPWIENLYLAERKI